MARINVGMLVLGALALGSVLARPALAVDQDDFKIATAQNLANLCGVLQNDPLYDAARQFCYGYIAGAGQFYRTMVQAGTMNPIACPKKEPTRDELATIFVAWLQTHAEHTTEAPLDALMRAAAGAWPCKK